MKELSDVLEKLGATGRLSPADKHWITEKLKEQRSHDLQLTVIKACADNPDLPYILMVLGGATVSTIGSVVDAAVTKPANNNAGWQDIGATLGDLALGTMKLSGLGGVILAGQLDSKFGGGGKSWQDIACNSVVIAGESVAAFGAGMLVLRAVFSGSSGGPAGLLGTIA